MATLAEHTDADARIPTATVMDARNGGEDYWFVFTTEHGLEAVIPFDHAEFDRRDDGTIRTVEFYRHHPRRPPMQAGWVEGGRADWGADVIDTLEAL